MYPELLQDAPSSSLTLPSRLGCFKDALTQSGAVQLEAVEWMERNSGNSAFASYPQ